MSRLSQADRLGVYVSVPFCRAKCSFCNFASGVSGAGRISEYVLRLRAEIDSAGARAAGLGAELPRLVDTVYFGGGTPSLLEPEQLRQIFEALRRQFAVEKDAEITLEAAPEQIADDVLEEAMRLGVNRVSLGVQSFVDRESRAVGRMHTGESCLQEIARLRSKGVNEIGADLIAGLPYQTRETWRASLEAACNSALTHLSVYLLEIDEGSRLGREVLGGGARLHAPGIASEELAAELYEDACEFLEENGFAQYEISNFARGAEHQSRHNRKYWERARYLGFGLDAHSMLLRADGSAVRFANADELNAYDAGSSGEITEIGESEAFEESVFLGLRLNEGLGVDGLRERFSSTRVRDCGERVEHLAREGLMLVEEGRWKLTRRGRLVSSEVFGELLAVMA
ncbi:MAG TPA: radical SAM family heme chaperone HemW [Acidobacteriaceae bacterium]|nr:radical SAM family heme chaperone HemW [Acidobacteriaceae bacterium]